VAAGPASWTDDERAALSAWLDGDGGPDDLEAWASGLERWGPPACVRAAHALAVLAFDQLAGSGAEYATRKALAACEDWLLDPTQAHARACAAAVEKTDDLAIRVFEEAPEVYVRVVLCRTAARMAAQALGPDATPGEDAAYAAKTTQEGCLPSAVEVRLVIAGALSPWADGSGDPVQDRVAARDAQ